MLWSGPIFINWLDEIIQVQNEIITYIVDSKLNAVLTFPVKQFEIIELNI